MYTGLSDDERSRLVEHKNIIYENYTNIVQELIPVVEARTAEFPHYIYVEMRSMFTHLARARTNGLSYEEKVKHISGAERHLNRMIRDLYKDICGLIAETSVDFMDRNADAIQLVGERGEFYHEVFDRERQARNAYLDAKDLDSKGCLTDDDELRLFQKYEEASTLYSSLEQLIIGKEAEILEKATTLTSRAEKPTKKWAIVSILATVVSSGIFFVLGILISK